MVLPSKAYMLRISRPLLFTNGSTSDVCNIYIHPRCCNYSISVRYTMEHTGTPTLLAKLTLLAFHVRIYVHCIYYARSHCIIIFSSIIAQLIYMIAPFVYIELVHIA